MRIKAYIIFIIFLFCDNLWAATYNVYAFQNYTTSQSQQMELIGIVTTKSTMITEEQRGRIMDYDTRQMILTARLYENKGLKIGDEIYVISKDPNHDQYKNGLIVARVEIISIFKTEFQGWMIKAKGNISMVKKGHFIARIEISEKRQKAMEYYKQGDKYMTLKDYPSAYVSYKKSITVDRNNPETLMRLANLMKIEGMDSQYDSYIREAWKNYKQIENPNDVITLPGIYMGIELNAIDQIKSTKEKLSRTLSLLDSVRGYGRQIEWIKDYFNKGQLAMLEKRGIPDYNYQYFMGILYTNVYEILSKTSLNQVLSWISPEERKILLKEIYLPYRAQGDAFEYPEKAWDGAYFEGALYFFQMANELDTLDTRASYQIIMLAYNHLKKGVTETKKNELKEYIKHYSRIYLRVPDESVRFSVVREISNTVFQQ